MTASLHTTRSPVPTILLIIPLTILVALSASASSQGDTAVPEVEGLVTLQSSYDFTETRKRLEQAIADGSVRLIATIDHGANAADAGLELPPTTLYIFGNPMAGTPLMQDGRTVAIDLPQKMLVWEAEDGRTYLSYNDPGYLGERHGLEGVDTVLGNIAGALENLAAAATQ